jgi:hypothetical protein
MFCISRLIFLFLNRLYDVCTLALFSRCVALETSFRCLARHPILTELKLRVDIFGFSNANDGFQDCA